MFSSVIFIWTIALFLQCGEASRQPFRLSDSSSTADIHNLDFSALTGRWYEMYASPFLVDLLQQLGGIYCPISDLSETSTAKGEQNIAFSLASFMKVGGVQAEQRQSSGSVVNKTDESPGKFALTEYSPPLLQGWSSQYIDSNNILKLFKQGFESSTLVLDVYIIAIGNLPSDSLGYGPAGHGTHDNSQEYPWMIITGPYGYTYEILVRDVETFDTQYKAQVFDILKELGYSATPGGLYQSMVELQLSCTY